MLLYSAKRSFKSRLANSIRKMKNQKTTRVSTEKIEACRNTYVRTESTVKPALE
jgi:hypothetical protein